MLRQVYDDPQVQDRRDAHDVSVVQNSIHEKDGFGVFRIEVDANRSFKTRRGLIGYQRGGLVGYKECDQIGCGCLVCFERIGCE